MRVVLDTNVLLSALISPHGAPDAIYRAWRASRFELVTSTEQLDELRRVSRYPKLKTILPTHRVGAMVNNMQRAVVLDHLPPRLSTSLSPIRTMLFCSAWRYRAMPMSSSLVTAVPGCCNWGTQAVPVS